MPPETVQGACAAFRTNPGAFMVNHEVYWEGAAPADACLLNARMITVVGATARIRTGSRLFGRGNVKASVPVYKIKAVGSPDSDWRPVQAPPAGADLEVWWSGYRGGQARHVELPAVGGPNIMLTPELTGCTVVWEENPDGSALFAHYNLLDHGSAQTLEAGTMEAIAHAQFGDTVHTMSKERYREFSKRGGNLKVTVVGFRDGGRWGFWAQYRENKAHNGQNRSQIRRVERLE